MTFLKNHDLSQLSVQSFFEKMCKIQERRATDQQFRVKVKAYSPLGKFNELDYAQAKWLAKQHHYFAVIKLE